MGIERDRRVGRRPTGRERRSQDVEVEFVALRQLVVCTAFESLAFFSLVAVLWIVAGDEIIQVAARIAGAGRCKAR
jgi:hypothetical protein